MPAPAAAPARPAKKARRATVAKGGGDGSAGKRPGRPPKWPERGDSAARDAAAAMLPGDYTRVEQVRTSCKRFPRPQAEERQTRLVFCERAEFASISSSSNLLRDTNHALFAYNKTLSPHWPRRQVWVQAPGRPPFQLARLVGAPHGQPALALRQVQVRYDIIRL